jgi:hypothetical protein
VAKKMRSSAKSAGCIYPNYRQFQSNPCYVHRVEDKDPVLETGGSCTVQLSGVGSIIFCLESAIQ